MIKNDEGKVVKYTNRECIQFVEDMRLAGHDAEHYYGRYYWEGPAVRVDSYEFDEVKESTRVRTQHDQMGMGFIIYPVESDKGMGESE